MRGGGVAEEVSVQTGNFISSYMTVDHRFCNLQETDAVSSSLSVVSMEDHLRCHATKVLIVPSSHPPPRRCDSLKTPVRLSVLVRGCDSLEVDYPSLWLIPVSAGKKITSK